MQYFKHHSFCCRPSSARTRPPPATLHLVNHAGPSLSCSSLTNTSLGATSTPPIPTTRPSSGNARNRTDASAPRRQQQRFHSSPVGIDAFFRNLAGQQQQQQQQNILSSSSPDSASSSSITSQDSGINTRKNPDRPGTGYRTGFTCTVRGSNSSSSVALSLNNPGLPSSQSASQLQRSNPNARNSRRLHPSSSTSPLDSSIVVSRSTSHPLLLSCLTSQRASPERPIDNCVIVAADGTQRNGRFGNQARVTRSPLRIQTSPLRGHESPLSCSPSSRVKASPSPLSSSPSSHGNRVRTSPSPSSALPSSGSCQGEGIVMSTKYGVPLDGSEALEEALKQMDMMMMASQCKSISSIF